MSRKSTKVKVAGRLVWFGRHSVERFASRLHLEPGHAARTIYEQVSDDGYMQEIKPREFHWGEQSLKHRALTEAWVVLRDFPDKGTIIAWPVAPRPGHGSDLIAMTTLVRFPPRDGV